LLMAVGFPGPGVNEDSEIKSGVEVYSMDEQGKYGYYGQMIVPVEQYDNTGYKVSLSRDGQILALSSPDYDRHRGMVRVYKYNPKKGQKGIGLYQPLGDEIMGEENSEFGWSLALSSDGTSLVAGSPEKLYVSVYITKGNTHGFLVFLQILFIAGAITGLSYVTYKGYKLYRQRVPPRPPNGHPSNMTPVPTTVDGGDNDMNNQGLEFPVRPKQMRVPKHDLDLELQTEDPDRAIT